MEKMFCKYFSGSTTKLKCFIQIHSIRPGEMCICFHPLLQTMQPDVILLRSDKVTNLTRLTHGPALSHCGFDKKQKFVPCIAWRMARRGRGRPIRPTAASVISFHSGGRIISCPLMSLQLTQENQNMAAVWHTEMCKFPENAPGARGSEEAGLTQFLAHKSTLLYELPPCRH